MSARLMYECTLLRSHLSYSTLERFKHLEQNGTVCNRDKAESTRLRLHCRCQQKHCGNYTACWSSSSSVTASGETTAFPDPFLTPRVTRFLHAIVSAGLTLEGLFTLHSSPAVQAVLATLKTTPRTLHAVAMPGQPHSPHSH